MHSSSPDSCCSPHSPLRGAEAREAPCPGVSLQEFQALFQNNPRSHASFPSRWVEQLHVRACILSCLSCVQLCAAPWTVDHQAPLSTGFSRQQYWSGLLFPPPEDLPDPGIEPTSLKSPALAGGFFTTSASWEAWSSSMAACNLSPPYLPPTQEVSSPSGPASLLSLSTSLECFCSACKD